jgi:hypothetical protein
LHCHGLGRGAVGAVTKPGVCTVLSSLLHAFQVRDELGSGAAEHFDERRVGGTSCVPLCDDFALQLEVAHEPQLGFLLQDQRFLPRAGPRE